MRNRRRLSALLVVTAGAAAAPAPAVATAFVGMNVGALPNLLTVLVVPGPGQDDDHRMRIGARAILRDFQLVQGVAVTDAPLGTNDTNFCATFGGAVECIRGRTPGVSIRASITTLGGDDRVELRDFALDAVGLEGQARCVNDEVGVAPAAASADITLGGGDDVVLVDLACDQQQRGFQWSGLTADGESGDDVLTGTRGVDTLRGGLDDDTLQGFDDDDVLRGDDGADDIRGGAGDDDIRPGSGTDTVDAGPGDDTVFAGLQGGGPDTYRGGEGTDTVNYAFASGVRVNLSSTLALQGEPGEGDTVLAFENVSGGNGDDTLFGTSGPNVLRGAGGRDELFGNDGPDTLVGGDGPDRLVGGAGDDDLDARDGIDDLEISCGAGNDTVTADLRDLIIQNQRGDSPHLCEQSRLFAVDDGPPGRIASGLRRGGDGAWRIDLACPRDARVTCAGTLRVARPQAPALPLGSVRYAVRRGSRATLALRLPDAVRGRLVAITRERGVSRKGPRSFVREVVARRVP